MLGVLLVALLSTCSIRYGWATDNPHIFEEEKILEQLLRQVPHTQTQEEVVETMVNIGHFNVLAGEPSQEPTAEPTAVPTALPTFGSHLFSSNGGSAFFSTSDFSSSVDTSLMSFSFSLGSFPLSNSNIPVHMPTKVPSSHSNSMSFDHSFQPSSLPTEAPTMHSTSMIFEFSASADVYTFSTAHPPLSDGATHTPTVLPSAVPTEAPPTALSNSLIFEFSTSVDVYSFSIDIPPVSDGVLSTSTSEAAPTSTPTQEPVHFSGFDSVSANVLSFSTIFLTFPNEFSDGSSAPAAPTSTPTQEPVHFSGFDSVSSNVLSFSTIFLTFPNEFSDGSSAPAAPTSTPTQEPVHLSFLDSFSNPPNVLSFSTIFLTFPNELSDQSSTPAAPTSTPTQEPVHLSGFDSVSANVLSFSTIFLTFSNDFSAAPTSVQSFSVHSNSGVQEFSASADLLSFSAGPHSHSFVGSADHSGHSVEFESSMFSQSVPDITAMPNIHPTLGPTTKPTTTPTLGPSVNPTINPSASPTLFPTVTPTSTTAPSQVPTTTPTMAPTPKPGDPTLAPIASPSPSTAPTAPPTISVSAGPSVRPTRMPTVNPTIAPTSLAPVRSPTVKPGEPTTNPITRPSAAPINTPTAMPSTLTPTAIPTAKPTPAPSRNPISRPTYGPTATPTVTVTVRLGAPTAEPTSSAPTVASTAAPTVDFRAPLISNPLTTLATRNTILVTVAFTGATVNPGTVYCTAFKSGAVLQTDVTAGLVVTTGYGAPYSVGSQSAFVTVSGLKSITAYDLYCATVTRDGVQSLSADVQATLVPVTTACCKLLTFTNSPSYVYGSLDKYSTSTPAAQYVFTYTMSSNPSGTAIITPTIVDEFGDTVLSSELSVIPASTTFTATSALTGAFVLSGSSSLSKKYTITLTPSGPMGSEVYAFTSTTVTVRSSDSAAPTPVLRSAKFANSGASIDVTFDSATNKGALADAFTCSDLLTFVGVSNAKCTWVSTSVARITFSATTQGTNLVDVGGQVTLVAGKIKAACVSPATAAVCLGYQSAGVQSVNVEVADTPVVPKVVLRVPSVIAGCDDVKIDPTLSSGSGGRGWKAVSWSVEKILVTGVADTNTGDILATLIDYGPVTNVPYIIPKALVASARYTVTLTLTNFLDQKSAASSTFTIDGNVNLPIISILGPSVVTIVPNDALTLYTSTARASCYIPSSTLTYEWFVYEDGVLRSDIKSVVDSSTKTKFVLAPYTLSVQKVYTIKFVATATATANPYHETISASESVTVQVGNGAIVAVVVGGKFRSLAANSGFVTLDASGSYDQNFAPGSAVVGTALSYSWSCQKVSAANYSAPCGPALPTAKTSSTLKIPAEHLSFEELFEFTVTAAAVDGRSSAFAVTVQNQAGSTSTSINNAVLAKVNPGKKLVLTGIIMGRYALDASWSALVDGVPQIFTASTPLSGTFRKDQVLNSLAFPLAVPRNTFSPGSTVVFRLKANSAGNENLFPSYSDVTIVMNAPPSGGSIEADPSTGEALSDTFALTAASWSDDPADFPLNYEYSYKTLSTQPGLTLQSKTTSNTVSTTLPAGLESQSYQITLICTVYDSFLSTGSGSTTVTVTSSNNVDVGAYVDAQLELSLNTGNADQMAQVIANAATSVNVVDCSAMSTAACDALNRDACYQTPQTCSSCKTGYTGLTGDRNTLCRLSTDATVLKDAGETCTTGDDCKLGLCTASKCAVPIMQCPSVDLATICSGHGTCGYTNSAGKDYKRTCLITDTDCTAQCVCDNGYGGASCSLSSAELAGRDSTREKLCNTVITISESDDVSTTLLDTLISALYSAYDPNEVVSASANAKCTKALKVLSDYAAQGLLAEESTELIIKVTSKFAKNAANKNSQAGQRARLAAGRSLQEIEAEAEESGAAVESAIGGIISGVLGNMANGQDPVTIASDEMQLTVARSLASESLTVAPPLTEEAEEYGTSTTSSVEWTQTATTSLASADGYVQVSAMTWGVNPFPSTTSDVQNSLFRIEATVPEGARRRAQESVRNGTEADFFVNIQFSAKQDFNFSITIDEAIQHGVRNFTIPECRYYDGADYVKCDGCWVSTYTNYNVTYGCPLSAFFDLSNTRSRLLQTADSTTVQFGTVLGSASAGFDENFSSSPFKVDWATAKIVLGFMAALTAVILIGFVLFLRWDALDKSALARAQEEVAAKEVLRKNEQLVPTFESKAKQPGSPSWQQANPMRAAQFNKPAAAAAEATANARGRGSVSSLPVIVRGNSATLTPSKLVGTDAQYDELFEIGSLEVAAKSHELYVTNVVANFLESVMPEESLSKNSETSWSTFIYTVLRYHEYTAMFFGSSLKFTRTLRWTNITLGFLLNLFFNTLFYGIFYPDAGSCEDYDSRDACLEPDSQISSTRLCKWTEDVSMIGGGECKLNPPPHTFVFFITVVVCIVVISIPLQVAYDFILSTYCMRRPDWGQRSAQNSANEDAVQESPIKLIFHHAEARRNEHLNADNVYDSYTPPEQEADELLRDAMGFLDVHANAPKVPWQNSKYSVVTQSKANAIQKYLGIYPDGRPVPMTLSDWMLYGSPKKKLVSQITEARAKSEVIKQRLTNFGKDDLQNRDKMLIQDFILEQFTTFKKFLLHRHVFCSNNLSASTPVHPAVWVLSWTFVILSIAFFLAWDFVWGAMQGGHTASAWGVVIGTALAQDLLVVQIFRVYIIYSLSMVSIKPQLQYIYRVLNKVAISYAQDELDDNYLDVRVCQHLSPACRTAHSQAARNLATANILRHIDDADVVVCRLKYDVSLAIVAATVFAIPLFLAFVSEAAGDFVLLSFLPAFLDAALIMNYYFYTNAGLFIILPYGVFILMYLWQRTTHDTTVKLCLSREKGETDAEYAHRWTASRRSAAERKPLHTAYEMTVYSTYYLRHPLLVLRAATDWWYGVPNPVFAIQWSLRNVPVDLQALETTEKAAPDKLDLELEAKVPRTQQPAEESTTMNIKHRIPTEVTELLCVTKNSPDTAWAIRARGSDYVGSMLAPKANLHPTAPLTVPHGPLVHSQRTQEFLTNNMMIVNAEAALDHFLRTYRKNVSLGYMNLVDPIELNELYGSDTANCNVLIEFFDIQILLEEVLSMFQPVDKPLSTIEKDEFVDSCYSWLVRNGDSFLELHYDNDTTRIAAATLARINSSRGSAPPEDIGAKSTNFSVPFQQFRRWFLSTGAALTRYREVQEQIDDQLQMEQVLTEMDTNDKETYDL